MPHPTRFYGLAGADLEQLQHTLTFDKVASLDHEAAVDLLSRYLTLRNALIRLAWDPKSTRQQLRDLVTDPPPERAKADVEAAKHRHDEHGAWRGSSSS